MALEVSYLEAGWKKSGPKIAPRRPQDAPKTPPRRLKTAQDAPKTAQDAPKTAPGGSKMPPRGLKRPSRGLKAPLIINHQSHHLLRGGGWFTMVRVGAAGWWTDPDASEIPPIDTQPSIPNDPPPTKAREGSTPEGNHDSPRRVVASRSTSRRPGNGIAPRTRQGRQVATRRQQVGP